MNTYRIPSSPHEHKSTSVPYQTIEANVSTSTHTGLIYREDIASSARWWRAVCRPSGSPRLLRAVFQAIGKDDAREYMARLHHVPLHGVTEVEMLPLAWPKAVTDGGREDLRCPSN